MKSNNPVFARSEEFNGRANAYGNQTYAGGGQPYPGYGQAPSAPEYGDPSAYGTGTPGQVDQGRMTIDSVVQKTSISLAIVIAFAALTWFWTGDSITEAGTTNPDAVGKLYLALMVGSFGAFALSMVNSFKKVVSPALVIAFAALEGVALGAFSKVIPAVAGVSTDIVLQAVIGTFAAFAGTLAAYKFFNIQVGTKFRTFVVAAMFGMVALGLMEMVLGFFGNQIGFFGFGGIGLLFAIGGLVLGVFMLILDFDFVEKGIAAGLPERDSWRAAFGLTVSLVWIYTNLLRILAIFQQD
ncbi:MULTISPECIES: Bax inhibitor-1/YccA family protein [Nocardioides]|uniref:Bax inhibitor-1/YccA family protein n=1 Tax=Nocardioides TaxID=1839 RepID=UPI0004229A0B|nr:MULTISPECIES: Bax inhibitor-1/YccA family protein [Nocardioides]